jgi:hypothetical protein
MPTSLQIAMIGVALAAIVLSQLRRGSRAPEQPPVTITIRDVPSILTALSFKKRDGNFAVFLFGANGAPPAAADALNIQFSVEGGEIGIDWVLLSPLNIDAQQRFRSFFEESGRTVVEREMNGVRYLRVQAGHLGQLLQDFLQQEFGVTLDHRMSLITSRFKWYRAG